MLADGTADTVLRAALAAPDRSMASLARRLRSTPLLASVVAVLDEVDETGGDKDSHMAVVSMVNERGERGLLAFTGVDSLSAWNPEARPVPAVGRDIARSAKAEGAAAVIVDVVGPSTAVFAARDLDVLADLLDLPAVTRAVQELLGEVRVHDARSASDDADVLVEVAAELVSPAARALAADPDILRLVPGGIGVIAAGSMDL